MFWIRGAKTRSKGMLWFLGTVHGPIGYGKSSILNVVWYLRKRVVDLVLWRGREFRVRFFVKEGRDIRLILFAIWNCK